mmetsp:Transcript_12145/g.23211  ORF Transcript_12145/g.23211 Transcript_12145/m.23211 type:complete len:93 (+) Transcript_12145:157-435(+)
MRVADHVVGTLPRTPAVAEGVVADLAEADGDAEIAAAETDAFAPEAEANAVGAESAAEDAGESTTRFWGGRVTLSDEVPAVRDFQRRTWEQG